MPASTREGNETPHVGDAGRAVPRHDRLELAPKGSRYALCVFVINEGERLLAQLGRMRPWSSVVDIIVADGGAPTVRPSRVVWRASGSTRC